MTCLLLSLPILQSLFKWFLILFLLSFLWSSSYYSNFLLMTFTPSFFKCTFLFYADDSKWYAFVSSALDCVFLQTNSNTLARWCYVGKCHSMCYPNLPSILYRRFLVDNVDHLCETIVASKLKVMWCRKGSRLFKYIYGCHLLLSVV